MTTTVTARNQTLVVGEVTKIQVTEIVDDAGTPTRAIRIWGSAGINVPPSLEIIVSAPDAAAIKVGTPELAF
jgi:hypothetical protein